MSANTDLDNAVALVASGYADNEGRHDSMSTVTMDRPAGDQRGGQPPDRSLTQRLDALERANEVRTKRAALKRDLAGRRVSILDVLREPPECIETAKVFDLLLSVPKYGRVKTNKVLTTCRISPSKTIAGLSDRQRDELVSMLQGGIPNAPRRPGVANPYDPPTRVHMTTLARGSMHDAACGKILHRRHMTATEADVTCAGCKNAMRAATR